MSVRPDDVLQIASTKDWATISMGGRMWDERIRSAQYRHYTPARDPGLDGDIRSKFIKALSSDKSAGGPFLSFLEKKGQQMMINSLLLWQDVTDYCAEENRSADRLLRLLHAQSIFNKYALFSSPDKLDFDKDTLATLRSRLVSAKDSIPSSLFEEMKSSTVESLEHHWIRYLKEDLKQFLESSMTHRDSQSPPSTADNIEVFIQDGKIVVRNPPRQKRSRASGQSAESVIESVDEVRLAEQRRLRRERRKIMEKERKKAIRAAKIRLKEMKARKSDPSPRVPLTRDSTSAGQLDPDLAPIVESHLEEPEPEPEPVPVGKVADEDKPVTFNDVAANKTVMLLFKKQLLDQGEEGKDTVNLLNLHNELIGYQSITGAQANKKKDIQAQQIFKTFLDKQSKKSVHLPEKLENKLHHDKERPKSAHLKDLLTHVKGQLHQQFNVFWETQAADLGLNASNVHKLSAVDVAMRTGADFDSGSKKKKLGASGKENTQMSGSSGRGPRSSRKPEKKKLGGRAAPSRDDKIEFLIELESSAQGHLTVTMIYFYAYLGRWGDEDSLPHLDKDLIFYIETQKFKDWAHTDCDEELMKSKAQSLIEKFLECSPGPALQVDLPQECYNKTLRLTQKFAHKGLEAGPNIFDDAQFVVFKALLPYWAGFKKHFSMPEDIRDVPLTKYQKLFRKRLEMFQKAMTPKDYRLPGIPPGQVAALSFSLLDGMKWKSEDSLVEDDSGRLASMLPGASRRRPSGTGPRGLTSTSLGGPRTTPATAKSSSFEKVVYGKERTMSSVATSVG